MNIYHIRRGLKHWGYRRHWNTNMIQVYTILHAIDEADRKNLPNGTLYINKGHPPKRFKKRGRLNPRTQYLYWVRAKSEEQLHFTVCVIDQWNGLPINQNAFKSRLNRFWKDHPSLLPHGGPSQTGKTTTKSIHRGYLA